MTYAEYCKSQLGYECITTYWDDFTIAEHFGLEAIKDTYRMALHNKDYKMMTELSMVLNHKIWMWYEKDDKVAILYDKLWKDSLNVVEKTFTKAEKQYFYRVTD